MRMIPIHLAKRQSNRTKLSHAGAATAMVALTVGLAALGSAASAVAQDAEMVDYPTGYRLAARQEHGVSTRTPAL
jgi:hypothetical protein